MTDKDNHDPLNSDSEDIRSSERKSGSNNGSIRNDESNFEEKDQEELKTQHFSHDQLKDSVVGFKQQDGESFPAPRPSRDLHFRTPGKSPYRPLLVILAVVIFCFIALMVIQMIRTHRNTRVLERASQTPVHTSAESELLKSIRESEPRINSEEEPMKYLFPNGVFLGSAPLKIRGDAPVLSRDQDPEVAALADAFNVRYRLMFGINVSKRGETVTETCRGVFRRFGINSVMEKQSGEVIKDEITLLTPSGGVFRISDRMLESVSKVTFEGLENDLKRSGIIPQKEIIPEDSRIQVQLRITDDWQNRPVDPYLIHGDGLEEIKLGMAVSEMKRNLSTHHRILMRKIMVGNRFETIIKIDDLQRQPLFFIYQKDEKIWGIEVVHHRYKTLRGIGIGSTLGMVRICYPDVSIVSLPGRLTYISSSDSQHENIKYLLLDDNRIDFTKNEFPFDLKINSILVGNSPFLKE